MKDVAVLHQDQFVALDFLSLTHQCDVRVVVILQQFRQRERLVVGLQTFVAERLLWQVSQPTEIIKVLLLKMILILCSFTGQRQRSRRMCLLLVDDSSLRYFDHYETD